MANQSHFAEETTLTNGLRVISLPMAHAQSVAIGVFADVGSRDEPAALHGVSHALEHMLFKGAGAWDVHALSERLDELGGNANAYTSRERTCFHMQVLREAWREALALLSAMVCEPHLPAEEWEKEREVIYSEMAMVEDSPEEWVMDRHLAALFPGGSLGRTILGTRDSLAAMDVADLRRYLEAHYGAGNLLLAAAGHIEHDALVEAASAIDWLPSSAPPRRCRQRMASGLQRLVREGEQVHLVASWPSIRASSDERPLAWLANQMLGGGMSSRLFREVREKRGLAYSVSSHLSLLSDVGTWGILCGCPPVHGAACAEVLQQVLREFTATLNADELARAKRQLAVQLRMGMDSVESQMLYLGSRLDEARLRSPLEWVAAVEAVELEAVRDWIEAQLAQPALWTVAAPERDLQAIAARFELSDAPPFP